MEQRTARINLTWQTHGPVVAPGRLQIDTAADRVEAPETAEHGYYGS